MPIATSPQISLTPYEEHLESQLVELENLRTELRDIVPANGMEAQCYWLKLDGRARALKAVIVSSEAPANALEQLDELVAAFRKFRLRLHDRESHCYT